jgi:K+-sensing histidine kinase KdpD
VGKSRRVTWNADVRPGRDRRFHAQRTPRLLQLVLSRRGGHSQGGHSHRPPGIAHSRSRLPTRPGPTTSRRGKGPHLVLRAATICTKRVANTLSPCPGFCRHRRRKLSFSRGEIVTRPGTLRTYLGTAPGVGKTYAMLQEGRRRAEAGERVLVGWVERHGRPETRAQRGDLEVLPPRMLPHRGSSFADLDVPAVIDAAPDLVLVDELAHRLPDGERQRWEDVADILANGIDVLTTTNVANLLSVRDYAASITEVGATEYVPDEFVRSGDVILIDLPPEALRRRIASGKVYSVEAVGGALARFFRPQNLEALSQLGRAWMDGNVDPVGASLLVERGLDPLDSRPLVLVGVDDSRHGDTVIRQAAQQAVEDDGDLLVAHVTLMDGSPRRHRNLDELRDLTAELGGTFSEIHGESVPDALAEAARSAGATRVVVAPHRSRLTPRRSLAARLRRLLPDIPIDEVQDGE